MSVHSLHSDTNTIEDLTADEVGDLNLWIGQQKKYCNVPNFVSNELCRHTSPLHSVLELLPPTSLPVLQLLEFPTPRIMGTIPSTMPDALFSFHGATHTSLECCQLPAPTSDFLWQLRASVGQAMLDGKVSIRHWDREDIFLPFDALGTWAFILEINTAKKAWIDVLHWMEEQHHTILEEYTARIKSLLCQVPWKEFIKGLGSGLTITEMATFLSREWLSDTHIHTMLSVTRHLRYSALSGTDPCMQIASPDFAFHVFNSPLISTTHIASDYSHNAPKSVIRLGDKLQCATSGILIVAVSYSLSRAVLAPPSLSYKPVTPRPRDCGNIPHDPTRDSSHDPFATHTSRDLSARDPGNLRPRDPGKITHDLSRNWSSTMSHDKTRFGCASNPLINTWQIVGTINKTRPLNNQQTRDATRSTKTRLIRARP